MIVDLIVQKALHSSMCCLGFFSGSDGKEFTCNVGDRRSIPGLGRFPGGGNGNPLQYSCLENPLDRGPWWATVHGGAKSQTQLNRQHNLKQNSSVFLQRHFGIKSSSKLNGEGERKWNQRREQNGLAFTLPTLLRSLVRI